MVEASHLKVTLDPRKSCCGMWQRWDWNEEVCHDPMKLTLRDFEHVCDTDDDCVIGFVCADSNKATFRLVGLHPRKAYCGKVGKRE